MAKFRVELEQNDWQTVLNVLSNAPYREIAPLMGKISQQLTAGPVQQSNGAEQPAEPPPAS